MADQITILCLLHERRFEEHFAVTISPSSYFRDLRDAIKDKISECLIGTSTNQLQLYKVDIPIGNNSVVPSINLAGLTKISPQKQISEYFGSTFSPTTINIIVIQPRK